jgi:hypothetical protein
MMTPEDTAFAPTSESSRERAPSEEKRLPVPNRTRKTSGETSSASPCSSSVGVSVELPQTITSGPPFALRRRTPSTMSGPRSSTGPHSRLSGWWVATYFVAAFRLSAIGLFLAFDQKPLKMSRLCNLAPRLMIFPARERSLWKGSPGTGFRDKIESSSS